MTIAALLAAMLCGACVDDKGNYDYLPLSEVNTVAISGIEDAEYNVLSEVTIAPTITGMADAADYEFLWTVYNTAGGGGRDTLGRTRDITFIANFPVGQKMTLDLPSTEFGIPAPNTLDVSFAMGMTYNFSNFFVQGHDERYALYDVNLL